MKYSYRLLIIHRIMKYKLIRKEVIPVCVITEVEIEADDIKEAIEEVVEGYGEELSRTEEECSHSYSIEKYADRPTLEVTHDNEIVYNDSESFSHGINKYKCFE